MMCSVQSCCDPIQIRQVVFTQPAVIELSESLNFLEAVRHFDISQRDDAAASARRLAGK